MAGRLAPMSRKRLVEHVDPDTVASNPKSKQKPAHYGKVDNNEVETPDNVMHEIHNEWPGFFDPCPFVGKGKVPDFDGKSIDWKVANYVNPPYNDVESWFAKAVEEAKKGCTSVFLVPARTGRRYWQRYVYPYADELRWITGNVIFKGYTEPSPHGLVIIVFKPGHRVNQTPPPAIQPPRNMDVFDPNPLFTRKELQLEYPELFLVCTTAHRTGPVLESTHEARAKKWKAVSCSLMDLIDRPDNIAENLSALYLPFFFQLCRYEELHCSGNRDLQETLRSTTPADFTTKRPLMEVLYKWKSLFFTTDALASDFFLGSSALECAKDDWLDDVAAFYRAYMSTVQTERGKATRTYYSKISDDGRFIQHVTYL